MDGLRRGRRLMALGTGLLLALLLVVPAAAATRTVVLQINVAMPGTGAAVLGTVTADYDEATGDVAWSFQGTINGEFAQASGTAHVGGGTATTPSPASRLGGLALGSIGGSLLGATLGHTATATSATVTLTGITQWQVPHVKAPAIGASGGITDGPGNTLLLSYGALQGVPIATNPPLTIPPAGGGYTVTTPGSGSQNVPNLPNTGDGPPGARVMRVGLPLGLGLLALTLVVPLAGRRIARMRAAS